MFRTFQSSIASLSRALSSRTLTSTSLPPTEQFLQNKSRIEKSMRASGMLTSGKKLEDFLYANNLASPGEKVWDVFQRATYFLAEAGRKYDGETQLASNHKRLLDAVSKFQIILGSPILTNAGRRLDKSVSACSIPPVELGKMSQDEIAKMVASYHTQGMGTGFNLDDLEDPVQMVKYLNHIAIKEVQEGKIERSCGNMGVLSVDHPEVISYIRVRVENPEIKEWKFNLSVNLTDAFYSALASGDSFYLKDGSSVDPQDLMKQIAENAHATGDPGLIFMDRINQLNRLPQKGAYKTVVPCGEVSLFSGEVCQFGYLNLRNFIKDGEIDQSALRESVHLATWMLDNAVDANIERMPNSESREVISELRRIGIGVCGFAEVLQAYFLPYDSHEARTLAQNIMSLINYESKRASIELAKKRGPFPLFEHSSTRKDLFVESYAQHPTEFVTKEDWKRLQKEFMEHSIRNLATTILPPSGRSSALAGVTGSIEPPFRLINDDFFQSSIDKAASKYNYSGSLSEVLNIVEQTGSVTETGLPSEMKKIFATALEISPIGHLEMTAAFQRQVDEGISKTINMPNNASVEDVESILKLAYKQELKGITVYRDNCRDLQPKELMKSSSTLTIRDPIYGSAKISERLNRLLNSSILQRLKKVRQNGANVLVDNRLCDSRYNHSVGVMLLTKMLGGSEEDQIVALLHDASHTAFSHVADFVFGYPNQDFHNQIKTEFWQSKQALEVIQEFGLTAKELDTTRNKIVKGKGVNADRIDYMLRDLKAINGISHPEYSSIINGLKMGETGEIECDTLDTARLLFNKFLKVNKEVYFNPKAEAAGVALAVILRKMYENGLLSKHDFFLTDDQVIEKIQAGPYRDVFSKIGPNMFYEEVAESRSLPALRKPRYLDPIVSGTSKRLTSLCDHSKQTLENYLKLPRTVHYNIPILDEVS